MKAYMIVSVIATLVEWTVFYLLPCGYIASTVIALLISTFANWFFGRLICFHTSCPVLIDILRIYAASAVGIGLNVFLMWILIFPAMLSKMIATILVFIYNYLVRKKLYGRYIPPGL